MLAGIAEPLISLADTAIVGNMQIDSAEALGGMGVAVSFFLFVFWTFVQLETALSSIVARYVGKGKEHELEGLITQTFVINVFLGLALYFGTNAIIEWVFGFYKAKGAILNYAIEYYSVRSLGFPVTLVLWTIWGLFRGLQNTSWAMFILIGGGIVNLVFDLILVYGVGEWIPAFGVAGAAWASFFAQCCMLVASLIMMWAKSPFRLKSLFPIHKELGKMVVMGVSFIARTVALNLALMAAVAMATDMGPTYIAAHTIAVQLWLFCAFLIDGYANAGLALSGKLLGAERWSEIRKLTDSLIRISWIVAGVIIVVFGALYYWIGGWFSNEYDVVAIFRSVFWLVIVSQPLSALAFTLDGVLKGMGKAVYLMILMWVALGVFFLTGWLLEGFNLGLTGIWLALSAWMILRSIWPYIYLRRFIGRRVDSA